MNQTPTSPDDEKRRAKYHSYLLRLWQTQNDEQSNWQASLENPRTGSRIGFANLEQLFAFLMKEIEGERKRDSD